MSGVTDPSRQPAPAGGPPTIATLVYCLHERQVLMLQRAKPPFPGLWTGVGGKVEAGESPVEGALRELHEETGLRAKHAELRGVLTETSPRPDWQWLIFAYVVREFTGDLVGDGREGVLRWWPLPDWPQIPMPEADQRFFGQVVLGTGAPHEATFHYDGELRLLPA